MAFDVEYFRNRLIQERDRLAEEIGPIVDMAQSPAEDRQLDAGDASALVEGTEIDRQVDHMNSERLERVFAALQSIDDGTYGTCANCGKEIDPRRLEVEPAALTCVECQSAAESNLKTPEM